MLRRSVSLVASAAALLVAPSAYACGGGYSYAGVASTRPVSGVGATLTSLAAPTVQNGHVAGWVGVGGAGLGPHGSSEWVQVGYSGFPGISVGSLYYEVALPGRNPQYHEVLSNVPAGATHRLAVLEVAHRPGWWRVWVDGRRVSIAYHLPGSAGAWRGVATAENWGGGMRACNEFAYRFARVSVTHAPGGTWRRLSSAYRLHSGGNHVIGGSASDFVARTTDLPPAAPQHRDRPPTSTRGATAETQGQATTPAAVTVPSPAAPPADPAATAATAPDATPPDAATTDEGGPVTPGSPG